MWFESPADRPTLMSDRDEMHTGFLTSLEAALGAQDASKEITSRHQAQTLLTNASAMLKLYHSANAKITTAFQDDALAAIQTNHEADVQTVKDVLAAGKRICAGELEGVEQQARAKELMGKSEVAEQAKGIFGQPRRVEGEGVERTLEFVERGVRRMVRGME